MSVQQINIALAAAIGLDVKGTKIFGFDLRVRSEKLPVLTVHSNIFEAKGLGHQVDVFDLTLRPMSRAVHRSPDWDRVRGRMLLDQEPFDLDKACEAALGRINAWIDLAASRALNRLPTPPGMEPYREFEDVPVLTDVVDVYGDSSHECTSSPRGDLQRVRHR